ncbi:MAG: acetyl-CoA C-acetyltransferase [Rhodospirillales bacterium]
MEGVYIAAAKRTAIGKLKGSLSGFAASDLGSHVIRGLLEEAEVEADAVSEVIMGQVLTGGAGQNPARQAALGAGLDISVPAMTVNKVCGAGQKSIHLAVQAIRCGDAEAVVAGGQDSMTEAPYMIEGARQGVSSGPATVKDTMVVDGLWDVFNDVHMGTTAEFLAQRYQVSRAEQDRFALRSQQKAAAALAAGRLAAETIAIEVPVKGSKGARRSFAEDEHPAPDTTLEGLARLKPVFAEGGSVTAGNASGLNDGAAAVLVVSEERLRALNLEPLARVAAYASAGVAPMEMGLGPVAASRLALEKAGWTATSLDLLEINEAFAAQAISVNRQMDWDPDLVNVNGGAIALGHPLAGSGCRIVVTLLHEMQRRDARRGLASLCIGGGLGVALCLER